MIGSLAAESEILTQTLAFRNDPLSFARWMYPWGTPGTPLAGKALRPWQIEELDRVGQHVRAQEFAHDNGLPVGLWRSAYASGRGPGKSALFGILAHWHVSCHPGAMAVVVANTETQLRTTTFPEFSKWISCAVNAHWFKVEGMKISAAPWLAEMVAKHPSLGGLGIDSEKWVIKGKTWVKDNPNAYAGEHNDFGLQVLFDEAAGIEPFVWDLTEGFYTETNPYRLWLAASQMRNRKGRFFDIFNDAKLGAGWRALTMSTRGLEGVNQAAVEDQIKRYGEDSDFVRVEIMGLPPMTADDQFIPWDSVKAAQRNELFRDPGEPLIMGVDPAPRGKTAWRFRQGRNARDCCGSATFGAWLGKDNVEIAEAILALDARFKPDFICVDFGMGTGVIDVLKRKRTRGRVIEVKFGDSPHGGKDNEWGTHAIELWALVRDWLPGGMIETDSGEKNTLSRELIDRGWQWSGREEGKKILETKENLQKRGVHSPDDADALACTFEVNPPRRENMAGGGRVLIADGVGSSAFFD